MSLSNSPLRDQQNKLDDLKEIISNMGSVIVAYSGGVDSAFLAITATQVLGRQALAVTAKSPSLAPAELNGALDLARRFGLNHRAVSYTHLTLPTSDLV